MSEYTGPPPCYKPDNRKPIPLDETLSKRLIVSGTLAKDIADLILSWEGSSRQDELDGTNNTIKMDEL